MDESGTEHVVSLNDNVNAGGHLHVAALLKHVHQSEGYQCYVQALFKAPLKRVNDIANDIASASSATDVFQQLPYFQQYQQMTESVAHDIAHDIG